MTDDPLSLEQELSEFMVKDGYGRTGIFIDEDRFEEVMMRMVKIVSESAARNDSAAKQRADAAEEVRNELRRHILLNPSLTAGELTRLTGAGSTVIAEVRKRLVDEGKIRRSRRQSGQGYERVEDDE